METINCKAYMVAIKFGTALCPLLNDLHSSEVLTDKSSLHAAVLDLANVLRQELSACAALTPEREVKLGFVATELGHAETEANLGNHHQALGAAQRAAGYVNEVLVDVMARMG